MGSGTSKQETPKPSDLFLDSSPPVVLPKYVAFKGNNGKYLTARIIEGHEYLEFSSSDIGDPGVINTSFNNADGTVRIRSNRFDKFWRRSPNWIWADSDDGSCDDPDTLFKATRVGGGGCIVLRSMGNGWFCKRLTTEGKTSCLNAGVETITAEARLQLEEPVLSREIYDVHFRLSEARVYGKTVLTMATASAINGTSSNNTAKLILAYTDTAMSTWDSSLALKIGVKAKITSGIPFIVNGNVEVTTEFAGSYSWGSSVERTSKQEMVYRAVIPPKTRVTASVIATRGSCDVPFSYTQRDLLTTGEVVRYDLHDGVYTGVNCYDVKYETKEEMI